jgi:hypothetical protein
MCVHCNVHCKNKIYCTSVHKFWTVDDIKEILTVIGSFLQDLLTVKYERNIKKSKFSKYAVHISVTQKFVNVQNSNGP